MKTETPDWESFLRDIFPGVSLRLIRRSIIKALRQGQVGKPDLFNR